MTAFVCAGPDRAGGFQTIDALHIVGSSHGTSMETRHSRTRDIKTNPGKISRVTLAMRLMVTLYEAAGYAIQDELKRPLPRIYTTYGTS